MTLKEYEDKNNILYEHPAAWRRKLRLQALVDIARKEIESGKEFDDLSSMLEQEMQTRWRLVPSTRKQYLDTLKKILSNQFVLVR